jgi:hypothetical protein
MSPHIRFLRKAIMVFTLMTILAMIAQTILSATARADQPLYNTAAPVAAQAIPANPGPVPSTSVPGIKGETPSSQALQLGKAAGGVCPDHWDSPECLSVISQSNFMMLANYGSDLQQKGHNDEAEQVKQHCAASTAAREQSFPAYAMKSAFIECANLLSDLTEKTGMKPDMSEYQLMVGSVLCMNKDARCASISEQLKALTVQK